MRRQTLQEVICHSPLLVSDLAIAAPVGRTRRTQSCCLVRHMYWTTIDHSGCSKATIGTLTL